MFEREYYQETKQRGRVSGLGQSDGKDANNESSDAAKQHRVRSQNAAYCELEHIGFRWSSRERGERSYETPVATSSEACEGLA